ncbi:hsp70-Hsp90 organizing protein 3-like [Papaver somniferum]|uniref:hsp70-Hsp90 organizing protein 3-like n=1 Tax=Papaver somniferum TaxID=3469 RepID=UPI000E705433|nr:hsp70-Hsp90 organizing protein 3-like [Papaver somniferum]
MGLVTPLASTILTNSPEIMDLLLQAGADPNGKLRGIAPLALAVTYGLTQFIVRLLEAGADPNVTDIEGMAAVEHAAKEGKREIALEVAPTDATLISNRSACYARMQHGSEALRDATECISLKPDWPKAHYRAGVALSVLKRYGEAADAFFKGLTLDPRNKELADAFRDANETRLKYIVPQP